MDKIEELRDILLSGKKIVFFGGAGTSTECGIPDFRSPNGVYSKNGEKAEEMLQFSTMVNQPDIFFDFYKANLIHPNAKPNITHTFLTELEDRKILDVIITQNIDRLHQLSGSYSVVELHGSIYRNYCMECGDFHTLDYILNSEGAPKCKSCSGLVRPDVILFGESLRYKSLLAATNYIARADVLIVAGTSLRVSPAAELVNLYKKDDLIIINLEETKLDSRARIVIRDKVGEVFEMLDKAIR